MTGPGGGGANRYWIRDYPWAVRTRMRSIAERESPAEWGAGDLAPVVLLPGVYESWHFLRAVGDRLSRAGHPVTVIRALGINRAPIAASAAVVWQELVALDLRGVVLVAHSKGGLIGKHLLAFDDTEQRIDRLVAIATPFGGSSRARYMLARSLRDFRIDDPTIVTLGGERDVNARITSIFPAFDSHIPETSRLDGATNVLIDTSGHFAVLLDARTLDAVERSVSRG